MPFLTRRRLLGGAASGVLATLAASEAVLNFMDPRVWAKVPAQTLTVWWPNWGGIYNQEMVTFTKKYFEPLYPQIKVNMSFLPNYPQDKFLVAVAGGTPPDLTYMNMIYTIPFVLKGAFIPVDTTLHQHGIRISDFYSGAEQTFLWGGHMWGFPIDGDDPLMLYNKTLFAQAGLDPERPPSTLTELEQANKKLLQKGAGGVIRQVGYLADGSDPTQGNWDALWTWILTMGGQVYDPVHRSVAIHSPIGVKALEWMVEQTAALGGFAAESKFLASVNNSLGDPFLTGRVAMEPNGWWVWSALKQYAPHIDYGMAAWPYDPAVGPRPWAHGIWGVSVPKGARHVDAALLFSLWMLLSKEAPAWVAGGSNVSCYKPQLPGWIRAAEALTAGLPMQKYIPLYASNIQAIRVNPYYENPAPSSFFNWCNWAVQQAVAGKLKPAAALEQAASQIQQAVDSALASA